jgi:methylamine---corrinoid protein Co-methyltransferase
MFNILDLLERSTTGEPMAVADWDFAVAMAVRRLVKQYRLDWDRAHVINDDPARANAIFDAALDLALELGVYNYSTGRVVKFTPDELRMGLRRAPQAMTLGEGKDARTLYARRVCDPRYPLAWAGTPGTPVPEHLFLPMAVSYAQEPLVDMMTCGTLTHVDGRVVETGSPLEIVATRRELQYLREAQRRAGRPGIGLLAAQSSVSELGDLAVAHPAYLRPCDSHLVPMLNELKIENGNLSRAINSLEYGMLNASLACVIVGGMGGDAPGSAVVQAASFILANLVCLADYHLLHPIDIRHVATTTRAVLWVNSAVAQAFAQRAPCVIVGDIYPKSGAGTAELLYETAANAIVHTISGSHLEGCGAADGKYPNASGLEARFMAEVGRAVTAQGLDIKQANAMVTSLLEKYEFLFERGAAVNPGLPFDQVYDVETIQPTPPWQATYDATKQTVRALGLKHI